MAYYKNVILKTATAAVTATQCVIIYLKNEKPLTVCPENTNGRILDLQS
jgi:hypothetical protein